MKNVATHAQTDKARGKRGRADDDARQRDSARCLTPPMLAARWGCSPESIIGLIRAGRLPAFTVSVGRRRPRWRVSLEAVAVYEMTRQGSAAPKAPKRQKNGDVIEFF